MSVTLATAYVELIPTTRGIGPAVQRQFAPAEAIAAQAGAKSGEAFSRQAESRIHAAAGRIGSGLKTIVGLAVGAGAALGGVGIKTAAQMETSEIAFTTMLGSAKTAKAFLGDLSKFAAKTPFDLPGLQQSASSLISAGIEASKVVPIMTSLGNATSGMGTGAEGVQRATIAIQQMNAAGKIGAEDLNQLRDAGIPVFDLLTAATGKTKEEISAMAQSGKLGRQELEQLMTALETGKGLERFNGLMEKQSASLAGLASTFKDTFSVGLAEAVKPAIPLLKQGLGGATTFLSTTALPAVTTALGEGVGAVHAFGGAWKANDGDVTSSGFPGFMERVAYWLHGVIDGMKGLDFSSVSGFLASVNNVGGTAAPILADVGGSLAQLWPAFREFAAQAPTLATGGLKLLAGALGFLADHTDWIIAHMPLIVAGFVAWKVATLALNAAAAITPGLQLAVNASRIAAARSEMQLAGAHRAQAAARAASTVADRTGTAVTQGATKATIGQRLATIGASIAARAAAAGQWLLNAALTANPIGLVIAGIALLVAGLIWFFTQTELGRSIVAAAWAGIQAAAKTFVDWFMNNALPVIKTVLGALGTGFNWLWTNIIQPVFNFAGGAIRAFGMLIGKIFEIGVAVIKLVFGAAISWLWTAVIQPVFGWISGVISAAGRNWQIWLGAAGTFLRITLGPAFTWLYRTIIKPAMDGIGGAIKWVWDNIISPVFNRISDAVKKNVPGAFKTGVDAIKTAWNAIKEIAKAPVRFVVNQVINDGLIGGINGIAKLVGVSPLPRVALPPGFSEGGWTGPGPKMKPAGVVHADEFIIPKEATARMRRQHPGVLSYIMRYGDLPPYARGGLVHPIPRGAVVSQPFWPADGSGHNGIDFAAAAGTPVLAAGAGNVSQAHYSPFGGGNEVHVDHPNGLQTWYAHLSSFSVSEGQRVHGGQRVGGVGSTGNSTGNHLHYMVLQGGWPNYVNPAAYLSGGGEAGAPMNPIADMLGGLVDKFRAAFPTATVFADLAIGAGKKLFEGAIQWVWDKLGGLADVVKSVQNTAANAPPAYLMDGGGTIPPGLSWIMNNTRKPEHAITDARIKELAAGNGRGDAPLIGELHMHQNEQPDIVVEMLARRLERAGIK
jgi:tape measure domain-containing protein